MVGAVSSKIYQIYLNYAGGFKLIVVILLIYILHIVISKGADIFLKYCFDADDIL